MPKVLVSDNVAEDALAPLQETCEVHKKTGLSEDELVEIIGEYDALIVRSATKVTAKILRAADNLKIIGRAGVGVDNIDVPEATKKGVVVVNSPQGNTVSAAEHTMALLLGAARKLPWAHASMSRGEWDRKSFTGNELYRKTLGVVGFGRIGREVAARCASFQMKILAHDPFVTDDAIKSVGAQPSELDDLLAQADYITIHVPKVDATANLFSAERLRKIKPGAFLINCARGGIVDEPALVELVKEGHLTGAALDVFEVEPAPKDSPVRDCERLLTTPHLAASTEEAQVRVAVDVAEQIRDVLAGGPPRSAVNIGYIPPKVLNFLQPFVPLAERMGCFLYNLTGGKVKKISMTYRGEVADSRVSFLTKAAVKGVLACGIPETVNFVNALHVAEERGIEIAESKGRNPTAYSNILAMTLETDLGSHTILGTLFEDDQPRTVALDGLPISFILEGHKLISWQTDSPGVVGRVGNLLGREDINIAEMQVGRAAARTRAVMVMSVDEKPSTELVDEVKKLEGIEDAKLVTV